LLSWADNSVGRVEKIAPFIVDHGRGYKDAETSYDKATGKLNEENKLKDLFNFCIRNSGKYEMDHGKFHVTVSIKE
jgi:hypothetical protein